MGESGPVSTIRPHRSPWHRNIRRRSRPAGAPAPSPLRGCSSGLRDCRLCQPLGECRDFLTQSLVFGDLRLNCLRCRQHPRRCRFHFAPKMPQRRLRHRCRCAEQRRLLRILTLILKMQGFPAPPRSRSPRAWPCHAIVGQLHSPPSRPYRLPFPVSAFPP